MREPGCHGWARAHAVLVIIDAEFADLGAQLPDDYSDLLQNENVQHH